MISLNIETVASPALAQLTCIYQGLAATGIGFRVKEVQPHIYEIFELACLYEMFEIRQMEVGKATSLSHA